MHIARLPGQYAPLRPGEVASRSFAPMRLIAVVLVFTACAGASTEPPTTTEESAVDVAIDEWTREIESDLAERCALRGLNDCSELVIMLRDAECSVEGATFYIEGMGMGDVRNDVLAGLEALEDCPGLTG